MGDKETRLGAENRVKNVMEKMKDKLPDFVVGLEGGVEKVGSTLYCMAWYVVTSRFSLSHTNTHTHQLEGCASWRPKLCTSPSPGQRPFNFHVK